MCRPECSEPQHTGQFQSNVGCACVPEISCRDTSTVRKRTLHRAFLPYYKEQPIQSQPETVVLVHGLWMNGLEMSLLRWRLGKAGFVTQRFSYPTVHCDIAANAARLQQFLSDLDADTVHFVGHSLGGLLILQLFEDFPVQRPGRIVLLGTPFRGSATARNLARHAWGRRLLGRSLDQALLGDGPRWHGGRDLGVIAGTHSMGLGLLVGDLPQPNDGTVVVAETQGIPGAITHTHSSSHSSLLFSATVARQVGLFLRNGRFGAHNPINGS